VYVVETTKALQPSRPPGEGLGYPDHDAVTAKDVVKVLTVSADRAKRLVARLARDFPRDTSRARIGGSGGISTASSGAMRLKRVFPPDQLSRKILKIRDRDGCLSLRSAFASSWRMRSRVTERPLRGCGRCSCRCRSACEQCAPRGASMTRVRG
jgi:hypothetical protein